ncbi:tetratricopeptide repeat protein [Luteolibacter sp. AS25]|uniref:tetratricopeptide repeat protein n=1 Tax=Luteolibacter sp. AS25 TaxID=3135776 RepID=UPI00398B191F
MVFTMQCVAVGQVPETPQFDPSDVYFQAYLAIRNAEQLEKEGDFVGALEKYQRAMDLFGSVKKFYPDWKPEMVENRSDLTSNAIGKTRAKASEQIKKNKGVIAELEGGERAQATIFPNSEVVPLSKGILEVEPLQKRRLDDAAAEVERLKNELAAAEQKRSQVSASGSNNGNQASRDASRVNDLRKLNDTLSGKLRAAETNLEAMRARMAAGPVENEVKALNQQIEKLEQEREAMGMALKTSRGDHTEALSKIEILNADMEIMREQAKELRQKEANLERDLKTERSVANEVVSGQRRQMDAMEKALEEKSGQLKVANEQISSLKQELDESRAAYNELWEEKETLLLERDQMSALLKLNESGRIEELIEQNMGLAKTLREANEKVERMSRDNNSAKDDVVDALRDLAIAKSQINRLHKEKKDQEKRTQELTRRLRDEETFLMGGMAQSDPAEVEMLREVIQRQLRVQERRNQAKELLVEAARSLGKEDESLNEAIKLFDGAEMELSEEERDLVADQQVDGEFVSPFAKDRKTVGLATNQLNKELESYDRAATKAYLAGRLLPTRELYEMMIEQHPGHVPALCKLGVVQMKLGETEKAAESFQKAIELDGENAYANRMLGFSYLRMGDLASAETFVKRAVDIAPDDARGYLVLGTIDFQMNRLESAEANFKSSISVDPVPSEPYFNLAILHVKLGEMKDARKYYHQALERGAVPDPSLESRFEKIP